MQRSVGKRREAKWVTQPTMALKIKRHPILRNKSDIWFLAFNCQQENSYSRPNKALVRSFKGLGKYQFTITHPVFGPHPTRGYRGLWLRLNRKILNVALLRLRFCSIVAAKSNPIRARSRYISIFRVPDMVDICQWQTSTQCPFYVGVIKHL